MSDSKSAEGRGGVVAGNVERQWGKVAGEPGGAGVAAGGGGRQGAAARREPSTRTRGLHGESREGQWKAEEAG